MGRIYSVTELLPSGYCLIGNLRFAAVAACYEMDINIMTTHVVPPVSVGKLLPRRGDEKPLVTVLSGLNLLDRAFRRLAAGTQWDQLAGWVLTPAVPVQPQAPAADLCRLCGMEEEIPEAEMCGKCLELETMDAAAYSEFADTYTAGIG